MQAPSGFQTNMSWQSEPKGKNQVGQIAQALQVRPQGGLPSDTEVTKRNNKEQCSALTLRSGKTINKDVEFGGEENTEATPASTQMESEVPNKMNEEEGSKGIQSTKPSGGQYADATAKAVPTNQLHIDVPFLEAIDQMPTYAKFLKDIITKKRKIERHETVATTKEYVCTLVDVPPKRNDPGSFIIPCSIVDNYIGKALCDIGSSVNLMPKSVFMKLGMGVARPTTVILQLADRSHVRPEGKVEDLLVKVGKFVFPTDFLILDCEVDDKAPIILGQPFLATRRILIDYEKGEFTMRVGDQTMTINVFNTIRYMDDDVGCHYLQDSIVTTTVEDTELCYNNAIQIDDFVHLQEEDQEDVDDIPFKEQQIKHSTPRYALELKPLPSHLKYVYLGANDTLHVIISSQLNANQELSVVNLLKQYKKALGWTMNDLNGISPTTCMHKILLDDCLSNSVEPQRRLNPAMKKVVMKEIIKWLDVGIIYPISDSSWVSPVQCVPKKGGMTVITN
ncbi:hypothetical protein V6N13_020035 [Hibiscus sabdariffa]